MANSKSRLLTETATLAGCTTPPEADEQHLEIAFRSVEELRPHLRNAHTHPEGQIKQIANSIRAFGFRSPLIVDETGQVLAGHGRL